MSEKQDRHPVRKASELEQKYNFGQKFDKVNGAVVAATRAAGNANAAASSANAAAEEARQVASQAGFVITGTITEDGSSVEMDKSFAEILEAVNQKRRCTVVIEGTGLNIFELVFADASMIRFQQFSPEGVLISLEITSDGESK
ncbi:MAG: hypothetical protein IKK11_04660 [Oscillospiraceae bacterium]|nr:hypothetical protein [Oscillospiraceae bacterium]